MFGILPSTRDKIRGTRRVPASYSTRISLWATRSANTQIHLENW